MQIEFFKTPMGRKYYEGTLPELVRQIERLAEAVEKNNQLRMKQ